MATPREAERLIVLRFCRVQPHCCSSGSIFSRASSSGDDIERAENSRNREKVEGRITKLGSALVSQPSRLEWLGLFFDWSFSGRRIQPTANERSSRRKGSITCLQRKVCRPLGARGLEAVLVRTARAD